MTKRQKPKTPEQVMREAAERRARKASVESLKAQPDVVVRADEQHRVEYARRLDVFELLRTRKRGPSDERLQILPEDHYEAVRELEMEMAVMLGQDRQGTQGERVDGKKYPPGQNIADRQVEAGRAVAAWLKHVGYRHAEVMVRLIERPHGILTRWRETVQSSTGIKCEDAQVNFILSACEKVSTYPGRRKGHRQAEARGDLGQRSLGEIAMDRADAA